MAKIYQNRKMESEHWRMYNEHQASNLIAFVNEIMGETSFYGNAVLFSDKVAFFLEHLKEDAYIYTLSFYLDDHIVDERGLVLLLLQLLAKYPYGHGTDSMVEAYQKLSIIDNIHSKMHGFEIETKKGTITVYRALEMLGQRRISLKNYQLIQKDDVNLRMALFHSSFKEDTIVHCLMPRMFGGFSDEYYIKLQKEKGYLDFRRNCFYPNPSFEQYFEPKILLKRKGKNLKNDIPPLFQK